MLNATKFARPWMTITELANYWSTEIEVLLYSASAGDLIVGVRDYANSHSKPPAVGLNAPADYEGDPTQCQFVGVLSLATDDIERLASKGEASVEAAFLHRAWGIERIVFDVPLHVARTDLVVPMEVIAKHDSQANDGAAKTEGVLSEKKESTLLKQIGALALVIAKGAGYQYGGKPNISAIANKVLDEIKTLPAESQGNLNGHGLSSANIRANIKKGIDLIEGK